MSKALAAEEAARLGLPYSLRGVGKGFRSMTKVQIKGRVVTLNFRASLANWPLGIGSAID
jgi:hypothetical protein